MIERLEEQIRVVTKARLIAQGASRVKANAYADWLEQNKVMIEVTWGEPLVFPPITKPLIQDYRGISDGQLMVYSLEEIVLEKLRAILQHTKKLHEREWTRSRVSNCSLKSVHIC